jgi:vacuolar protein sorting-associated protein 35
LIDRLAAYAAREAENEDPEETKRQEEAAAKRLAERVRVQKAARAASSANIHANGTGWGSESTSDDASADPWNAPKSPTVAVSEAESKINNLSINGDGDVAPPVSDSASIPSVDSEKPAEGAVSEKPSVKKFRGIPEDVPLFEVFWKQIVELMKVGCSHYDQGCCLLYLQARPDLTIQDITALLVSLTNLSVSCYPDRLEYVDQVLGFAFDKTQEFAQRSHECLGTF